MATDHHRARGRRDGHKVVLRGRDEGAGTKTTVSDTEFKPSALVTGKLLSDHMAAWGSAPLIIDSDKGGRDGIHPMHSTPVNSTVEDTDGHNVSKPGAVIESPESPILDASTSESSSKEEEGEREGERRVEPCDTHSDDVFLGVSPMEKGDFPVKLSQSDSKLAYSRHSGNGSKLKDKLLENDHLPPLPTSRRRHQRPYTSPGRNSSSCSMDSYTSPVHNRTLLPSTTDSIGRQLTTVRRKPPKSGKASRKGGGRRNTCVHPEVDNRPPNLEVPSPLNLTATSTTLKNSTFSSMGTNKRTLSSTDSMSSTFSAPLTPLLTSSLRKGGGGGGGSQPGSGSAWGFDAEAQLESCFPDRHMQVLVVTWNMRQEKDLPDSLDDLLLPLSQDIAADMFVIGTQESTPARREWEVLIQQTLGPSYVLVQSSSLGVIYLLLYIRRDLIWFCSAVCTASFATRPGTLIKTKGAVGLSFTLFGSSFLFITSHFTAHDQKVTERNSDMQRIAANLSLSGDSELVMLDSFDHIFWFGDLNYRVELTRDQADQYLANSDWVSLLVKDQLTQEILHGNVFRGFSEQPISFAPSYKFDLHSDVYDSSEKRRVPSWTDRVLFKSREAAGIVGLTYDCCQSLKCSDHRPVYGIFRVKLVPSKELEGIPDSVVTFDREIYIQAQKQRKKAATRASVRSLEETDDVPPSSRSTANRTRNSGQVTSTMCNIL